MLGGLLGQDRGKVEIPGLDPCCGGLAMMHAARRAAPGLVVQGERKDVVARQGRGSGLPWLVLAAEHRAAEEELAGLDTRLGLAGRYCRAWSGAHGSRRSPRKGQHLVVAEEVERRPGLGCLAWS